MKFHAYEVAIEILGAVREPIRVLRMRNRDLADQIERAACSVLLNLAEGRKRMAKDRVFHFFRVAGGSNAEVRAGLEAATALGQLEVAQTEKALGLLDREAAMLWGLTH